MAAKEVITFLFGSWSSGRQLPRADYSIVSNISMLAKRAKHVESGYKVSLLLPGSGLISPSRTRGAIPDQWLFHHVRLAPHSYGTSSSGPHFPYRCGYERWPTCCPAER